MSLKSTPTAKKQNKKKSERQKEKNGVQTYPSTISSKRLGSGKHKKNKTTETEQSFYGVQLFTHTWALNGSEYRTSTISVSQSTLTHLHAHSHRNFKHTCTRRREEGRGFQGEGQHERTRPWTTEADIRRGGGNRGSRAGGSGVTTGRHHSTGHSRNTSNSGGGVADRDTARYASVVESQFFFYSKRWTHPMARGEKKTSCTVE